MTSHKKFAKDVGIIGLTNLLGALSGLIFLPILTKNLEIQDYGTWVQILVTINLIAPLATLMLSSALIRFLSSEKNNSEIKEGFFSVCILVLIMSLIFSTLLLIFSNIIAEKFTSHEDMIKIIAYLIPIWALCLVFLDFFRAFQQIRTYSLLIIFQTYGEVCLMFFFIISGFGLYGALLSLFIIRIILLFTMGYLIISKIGFKIPDFSKIKEYVSFSLPIIPTGLSSWVINSSDRYIIGFFLGSLYVGFYSPGYALGSIIGNYVGPLAFILFPVLSKLHDENKFEDVKFFLSMSLKYFLLLAIPSAFGLTLLSKELLIILSTQQIAEEGYLIIPIIALSTIFYGIYVIFSQILFFKNKTKFTAIVWLLASIINIVLNIIIIPYYGIIGAAFTMLVVYCFVLALTKFYAFKYFDFNIDFGFIMKSIFASVWMSLVIIKWPPVGILRVMITIGFCAVIYSVILLLLKGITKEEVRFFKELFKEV